MENMERLNLDFWKKKKILVTGHTGFKGAWAAFILNKLGAHVSGCALKPKKNQILYEKLKLKKKLVNDSFFDVSNEKKLDYFVKTSKPELIFHFAAQPLVIESYKKPLKTVKTNVLGTFNVLNLKKYDFVKNIIIITTDKCYENLNNKSYFSESDKLGGKDIYSSSKSCAELLTQAYRSSFCKNKCISSVRAGNVIGGGDFGKYRLMNDFFKSYFFKKELIIRNPDAVRPWQHIFDVLNGYFHLAEKSSENESLSSAWNFGPNKNGHLKVSKLINLFNSSLVNQIKVVYKKNNLYKEENEIFLKISKAKNVLNWRPKLQVGDLIKNTSEWYLDYFKDKNVHRLSNTQVERFEF